MYISLFSNFHSEAESLFTPWLIHYITRYSRRFKNSNLHKRK